MFTRWKIWTECPPVLWRLLLYRRLQFRCLLFGSSRQTAGVRAMTGPEFWLGLDSTWWPLIGHTIHKASSAQELSGSFATAAAEATLSTPGRGCSPTASKPGKAWETRWMGATLGLRTPPTALQGWTGFQQWVGTLCTLYSLYNVYTVYQCIHCTLYSVYTENPNCLAWPKPRQIYLFWTRQNVVFNYFSVQAKLSSVLIIWLHNPILDLSRTF